ncbi:hypothetical protein [Sandaracinus amylolyticus]|uniref:hypothetical protein n=1 Tax=Sandaracinus amylolyticus TaxID=927083 RepID=UPI001F37928C|nr:hypothetical protein [Sandaracinus amylolyticus]UJR81612.1 TPR domain protein, putative component of TonB system [Sandaracinus amylolyticus]
MSFLKRMFGGASAEDERREGDRLWGAKDFFQARQAYERAIEKAKGGGELREHCEARLVACADAMAEARIEEAEALRRDGQIEIARGELSTAIDLARSPKVRERARRAMEMLERRDAVEQATAVPELTDDERWAVIAGNWDEAQLDELDAHGDEGRAAILAVHAVADETDVEQQKVRAKSARAVLERLVESDADAVYLWLEVGRARLIDGDEEGGAKALGAFLERVGEDGNADARLAAHVALAALADKQGDEEKAIEWLQQGIDVMPGDPRPFLQLGVYLRQKGHAEEAVEVLETAIELMDEDRPSWEAFQELGLAKRDAGHDAEAIDLLEKVLRFFVARSRLDFPSSTARPLAELHEKAGRLERAADLYRGLANGSDRANHLAYHRDAARVLTELGLLAEARRMLTRAAALAEGQPEILADVEAKIAKLDEQLG